MAQAMESQSSNEAVRKEDDFMSDDHYFMALALLTGQRSTDPNKKIGACIVERVSEGKYGKVIAVGHHQVLPGCGDKDKKWCEYHAEIDAIMNCANANGSTMFVTVFPCNECVKLIVQTGIEQVFYLFENNENEIKNTASKKMHEKIKKYGDKVDDITVKITHEFVNPEETENSMAEVHFMAVAVLTSKRSRDPSTQVLHHIRYSSACGGCIVRDNKMIVAVGHNQMPRDEAEKYTWDSKKDGDSKKDNKHLYVCHAELNAIVSSTDARGCVMYVTLFPCNECAKLLIRVGIKKVFYLTNPNRKRDETIASRRMLQAEGIELVPFNGVAEDIVIKFQ